MWAKFSEDIAQRNQGRERCTVKCPEQTSLEILERTIKHFLEALVKQTTDTIAANNTKLDKGWTNGGSEANRAAREERQPPLSAIRKT